MSKAPFPPRFSCRGVRITGVEFVPLEGGTPSWRFTPMWIERAIAWIVDTVLGPPQG